MPKQNLTQLALKSLVKKPGRHADGGGLYFRVIGKGKCYWVFRYRLAGREREISLGPYPELTLEHAREKHADLRKQVKVDKVDPLAKRQAAKSGVAASGAVSTFGQMADQFIETHEGSWRSRKYRAPWRTTLTAHAASIRERPVDQVDTQAVLDVLKPLWAKTPDTGSRLRGRIEVVIDAARALGHISADRANPARWRGHLDKLLPKPKKLMRGHHRAMAYSDLPEFMARLSEMPSPAARALRFTILTACRTSEALRMTWDEVDFDKAVWTVPAGRMKMQREHTVPLSDPALAILRDQHEARNRNPYVFAGARPRQPLSAMSMPMLLRRLGVPVTVHGMRASFRMWAADVAHAPFEVAEQCLAHVVGNSASQAYNRSDMLARRRPVMAAWANFVCGDDASNVVPLRRGARP